MEFILNEYFKINKLKGQSLNIDENKKINFEKTNNIIYCKINENNIDKLQIILNNIRSKLINGSIIHFQNWYLNIHLFDKNKYDLLENWKKEYNIELIDFIGDNLDKLFIFRINPNQYYGWSD